MKSERRSEIPTSHIDSLSDEGRSRLLLDAIGDYAIYMLDPQGIVTSWNKGARRFKGYDANEIIGHHFSEFYARDDRERGLPQLGLDVAAREGKFESEGWRIRKDQTRFWAHVVIDPIRDPDGNLLGFAKITRDLTERHEAQERLKRTEQQFQVLVQSVKDYALYMLTPEGYVASWNAGAQRIKGYSGDEIIGQHFSKFYTVEDQQVGAPAETLSIATREGRFEKEGWRVRKSGERFWANIVVDAIRSDDGSLIGFAKITRDITDRKNTERELELAREALFQSQKMDAIGQLTGGVAHDFNNLLAAVLGSLEMAKKRLPEDLKLIRLIDNAMDGARRGAALTQRMLAFSRRQELNPIPVNAGELVASMISLLQSSLGPAVMIETRFPARLRPVLADINQLELSILNLAVNARDAMPNGGVITIEGREETVMHGVKPTRCVCISVKDQGIGMDEETLSRAVEPFFTTKGVGKGTGLGLSMVHGMAQQLNGKLVVKSKLNEGTSVELWLPAAAGSTDAGTEEIEAAASDSQKESLVVLVVDDDSLVMLNTSAMLEDLGHKIFEASNGQAALEILQSHPEIQLVITDQAMPGMTGLQLARAVETIRPDLPIVIATGYSELAANSGGERFVKLSKPFMFQDLTNAIDIATAKTSSF